MAFLTPYSARTLAFTITVLAFLTTGCSEGASRAQNGPAFVLDSVPVVHVRDEAGEIFQYLRSGTRTRDGTIVIADQYAARLHFFSSDGTFIRSVGERGQGPGEFSDIRWIGNCASDSLYVWDYVARNVLVFDESGTFRRAFRPQGSPHEMACSRGGTFAVLGLPYKHIGPTEKEGRALSPVWAMDHSGAILDTIPPVPFAENRPLGKLTRVTISDKVLFVGTADSASVDVFDLAGTHLRSVPAGIGGRAPDQANFDAAMENLLSVAPIREIRDRFRDMYRQIPLPDDMPPYFDLRTDPLGVLWVVVSGPGDSTTRLDAVSTAGNRLGTLNLPGRVQVFEIGADYVLGALLDANDVQDLVLYHFSRANGGGVS